MIVFVIREKKSKSRFFSKLTHAIKRAFSFLPNVLITCPILLLSFFFFVVVIFFRCCFSLWNKQSQRCYLFKAACAKYVSYQQYWAPLIVPQSARFTQRSYSFVGVPPLLVAVVVTPPLSHGIIKLSSYFTSSEQMRWGWLGKLFSCVSSPGSKLPSFQDSNDRQTKDESKTLLSKLCFSYLPVVKIITHSPILTKLQFIYPLTHIAQQHSNSQPGGLWVMLKANLLVCSCLSKFVPEITLSFQLSAFYNETVNNAVKKAQLLLLHI